MKKPQGEKATLPGSTRSDEPGIEPSEGVETDHPDTCQPLGGPAIAKTLDPWTRCIIGLPASAESPVIDEQLRAWLRYVYDEPAEAVDED